jgi:hypothetical protein
MNPAYVAQYREGGSLKHSLDRCIERYGICVHPKVLARVIFEGKARPVSLGAVGGRRIYDVPFSPEGIDQPVIIRCVYVQDEPGQIGRILTVLPPKFPREISAEKCKQLSKNSAQRRANEARQFRQANAEDEADEEF